MDKLDTCLDLRDTVDCFESIDNAVTVVHYDETRSTFPMIAKTAINHPWPIRNTEMKSRVGREAGCA